MLAATATRLFSTFAAMTAPCSVKAKGSLRRPPHLELDVADCDIKFLNSSTGIMLPISAIAWFRPMHIELWNRYPLHYPPCVSLQRKQPQLREVRKKHYAPRMNACQLKSC